MGRRRRRRRPGRVGGRARRAAAPPRGPRAPAGPVGLPARQAVRRRDRATRRRPRPCARRARPDRGLPRRSPDCTWSVRTAHRSPGRCGGPPRSCRGPSSTRGWCSAAVDAGAVLLRHTVRSLELRDDLVVLDGEIAARAVVGADGVNGVVRRSIGLPANPPGAMAVALRAYAATPRGHEDEQYMIMSGRGWPAYAWSFPIGDGTANVGYGMVLEDGSTSRTRLEDELHRLLPELGEVWDARAHRLPLSTWRPRQPDGRVVLAGDAASLINPFTGEGISYAVRSGSVAGIAALAGGAAGRIARSTLRRGLGGHLRGTGMIARLGRSPVGCRRRRPRGGRAINVSSTTWSRSVWPTAHSPRERCSRPRRVRLSRQ